MTDVNILIQNLQRGETRTVTTDGNSHNEHHPPTRIALQAVRAIQQLAQRVDMDQQTINRQGIEIQELLVALSQLRQQLEKQNEIKTNSNPTDGTDGTITGTNS